MECLVTSHGWIEPSITPGASGPDPWTASVRAEVADFAQSLAEDKEPPATALDGHAVLQ